MSTVTPDGEALEASDVGCAVAGTPDSEDGAISVAELVAATLDIAELAAGAVELPNTPN